MKRHYLNVLLKGHTLCIIHEDLLDTTLCPLLFIVLMNNLPILCLFYVNSPLDMCADDSTLHTITDMIECLEDTLIMETEMFYDAIKVRKATG